MPLITAFHSAALSGNVAACQLLLDHHFDSGCYEAVLERQDSRGLRALDYATAAGHIRTAGSWLLRRGAEPLQHLAVRQRPFLAPLYFLCHWGRYRDAQYLLEQVPHGTADYTLALQLCFLRPREPYLGENQPIMSPTPQRSLRIFFEYSLAYFMERKSSAMPESDSEEALVCLIKQLLKAGADPNAVFNVTDVGISGNPVWPSNKSALHLAAASGHRAAVHVLLDGGAELESRPSADGGVTRRLGPSPLGSAMTSSHPTASNDPRVQLEIIIDLLERGASLRHSTAQPSETESSPREWLQLFFFRSCRVPALCEPSHLDLFGRILELGAKQERKERFPTEWAVDLLCMAMCRPECGAEFCKW